MPVPPYISFHPKLLAIFSTYFSFFVKYKVVPRPLLNLCSLDYQKARLPTFFMFAYPRTLIGLCNKSKITSAPIKEHLLSLALYEGVNELGEAARQRSEIA